MYNIAEDDTKYEISNIGTSAFLDIGDIQKLPYIEIRMGESTILNLNIQSINFMFITAYPILGDIADDGL